jgi:hypothetical protein
MTEGADINRKEEVRAIKSKDKDKGSPPSANDPAKPKKSGKKKKELSREAIESRVRKALLSLMDKSENDCVRISAAKVLVASLRTSKKIRIDDDFEQDDHELEQTEAIGKASGAS